MRRRFALAALVALGIALLPATSAAATYTEPRLGEGPERPAGSLLGGYLYLSAGLETAFWAISFGDDSDIIGAFDRSTSPFILKSLKVELANLYGLDLAVNYLTDSITRAAGFDGADSLVAKEDPATRILLGEIRTPRLGPLGLHSSIRLARFESEAKVRSEFGGTAKTYLPAEGAPATANVGEKLQWGSTLRDYAFHASIAPARSSYEVLLGYRHLDVHTPTSVSIERYADSTIDDLLAQKLGDVLMGSHNTCRAFDSGLAWVGRSSALVLQGYFWAGKATLENQYLKTDGYCVGFGGEAGFRFTRGWWALQAGLRYTMSDMTFPEDIDRESPAVKLKKAFDFADVAGNPKSFGAGEEVVVGAFRMEQFVTLYASASVVF